MSNDTCPTPADHDFNETVHVALAYCGKCGRSAVEVYENTLLALAQKEASR